MSLLLIHNDIEDASESLETAINDIGELIDLGWDNLEEFYQNLKQAKTLLEVPAFFMEELEKESKARLEEYRNYF